MALAAWSQQTRCLHGRQASFYHGSLRGQLELTFGRRRPSQHPDSRHHLGSGHRRWGLGPTARLVPESRSLGYLRVPSRHQPHRAHLAALHGASGITRDRRLPCSESPCSGAPRQDLAAAVQAAAVQAAAARFLGSNTTHRPRTCHLSGGPRG